MGEKKNVIKMTPTWLKVTLTKEIERKKCSQTPSLSFVLSYLLHLFHYFLFYIIIYTIFTIYDTFHNILSLNDTRDTTNFTTYVLQMVCHQSQKIILNIYRIHYIF